MTLLLDTQALLWFLLDDLPFEQKGYELPEPFAAFWEWQLRINNFNLLHITVRKHKVLLHCHFTIGTLLTV